MLGVNKMVDSIDYIHDALDDGGAYAINIKHRHPVYKCREKPGVFLSLSK